jgi:conjugative relaxase-like TrwC/TraI family protein
VLQQLDPSTGAKLQNNGGRRASISAMDVTFSAEKEVSTLWLLGAGATRILIEHIIDEASGEAIGYLQTYAAMVRRGNGGLISRSSSGYLALRVDHSTARPVRGQAAPSLHRHYLLANLAEHEGAWTALGAKPLFNLQKTAEAIASQIIRQRTTELFGVVWLRDEAGIPRIEGFDVSLRKQLSPRTQQTWTRPSVRASMSWIEISGSRPSAPLGKGRRRAATIPTRPRGDRHALGRGDHLRHRDALASQGGRAAN